MRAKLAVDAMVISFAEQMQIELAQLRRKEIRVVLAKRRTVAVADPQPVRLQRPKPRHFAFEETCLVYSMQGGGTRIPLRPLDGDLGCIGLEHPHDAAGLGLAASHLVIAEHRAWFRMTRLDERADVRGGQLELARHRFSLAGREGRA